MAQQVIVIAIGTLMNQFIRSSWLSEP